MLRKPLETVSIAGAPSAIASTRDNSWEMGEISVLLTMADYTSRRPVQASNTALRRNGLREAIEV
jgi:hypothetical protein